MSKQNSNLAEFKDTCNRLSDRDLFVIKHFLNDLEDSEYNSKPPAVFQAAS